MRDSSARLSPCALRLLLHLGQEVLGELLEDIPCAFKEDIAVLDPSDRDDFHGDPNLVRFDLAAVHVPQRGFRSEAEVNFDGAALVRLSPA